MENKEFMKQDSIFFRSVAILMVVVAHYSDLIYIESGYKLWNILNKLGRYGVAIFFLVSGYGVAKSIKQKKLNYIFLFRRIKTVYFPFICMQILALIFIGMPSDNMTIKNWIFYFLGIDYWYIIVIFSLYCLFYISMKYIKRNQELGLFILVTGFNILLALMECDEWWYLTNYVFCLGVYLAFHQCSERKRSLLITILCFAGFVGSSIVYPKLDGVILHDFFKIIAALCFAGFVWFAYVLFPFHINLEPLNKLGECSLYIYVLHVQAISFLKLHNLTSLMSAVLLSLIIVMILAIIFQRLFTISAVYNF